MKVEKIPQLLTSADCTDSLKSEQVKENPSALAETVEMPSTIDVTRETGSETLLPTISSGSLLSSPRPKKQKQTENIFHLTTQKQSTVQAGTAKIEEDDSLSKVSGDGQGPVYEEETEEAAAWISCGMNPKAEDSRSDLVAGVERQPNAQQVNSASASQSVVNVTAQTDNNSHAGVESVAVSEAREKIKPKVVNIRRAKDVPDQNCKTQ